MLKWFRRSNKRTDLYAFEPNRNSAYPFAIVNVRSKQEKPGIVLCDVYTAPDLTHGVSKSTDELVFQHLSKNLAEIPTTKFEKMKQDGSLRGLAFA